MLPPAVIFLNSDINDAVKATLTTQLFLNEIITFNEFNHRILVEPFYKNIIQLNNLRILVILDSFLDQTNRNLADIVLFYSNGNVTVEKANIGPPGLTLPISRIDIYTLLRDIGSNNVTILPITSTTPPKSLGGIVINQLADSSGVHDPNPDNLLNNLDFINRK